MGKGEEVLSCGAGPRDGEMGWDVEKYKRLVSVGLDQGESADVLLTLHSELLGNHRTDKPGAQVKDRSLHMKQHTLQSDVPSISGLWQRRDTRLRQGGRAGI